MLAEAVAPPPGIPPSEWLYIIAALATIVGTWLVIRSAWKRYIRQRQAEAVDKADSTKAAIGLTEATRENTAALGKLGQDFHDFAIETRAALDGHSERLRRLEHPS